MRIGIASFYMNNIDTRVVNAQRQAIEHLIVDIRDRVDFNQVYTSISHDRSIDSYLDNTDYDITIFLDVDCVPISKAGLVRLIQSSASGRLVGCAQRANHIDNNEHLYAGPFCCALSRDVRRRIGAVSARATIRGDVAEEFTYAAEASGVEIDLIYPSSVMVPMWKLRGEAYFGLGTTYEGLIYHQFEIRTSRGIDAFTQACALVRQSN